MHILSVRVPSSEGPGWHAVFSQSFPKEGQVLMVDIPTDFLVSAGQSLTVGMSIHHQKAPEPGAWLRWTNPDARGVVIANTWDQTYIPSDRKLWEILEDVARHGIENPSHGTDCVCMDHYIREIKLHVSRAVPPDTGESQDVRHRVDARQRVAYVLGVLSRWL